MYLQQANQKDMLIMSLLISQSPTEMLDFLYSKWKKKNFVVSNMQWYLLYKTSDASVLLQDFQCFLK